MSVAFCSCGNAPETDVKSHVSGGRFHIFVRIVCPHCGRAGQWFDRTNRNDMIAEWLEET